MNQQLCFNVKNTIHIECHQRFKILAKLHEEEKKEVEGE